MTQIWYIIRDAITCVEHPNYASYFSGTKATERENACNLARAGSGIKINYNPSTSKRALALYAIYSLGVSHAYMQGYFYGELCCYGEDPCPNTCPDWQVNPAAWEMGTFASCGGEPQNTPDFAMGGHRCEYYDAWIFGKYGKGGYWNSDSNYLSNSDSLTDVPAHASINLLSTGTCVDYSFALTTILRKLGYSHDDIFSVNGKKHAYNLLRFPGEVEFHYVDTVGNRAGDVFGGTPDIRQSTMQRGFCLPCMTIVKTWKRGARMITTVRAHPIVLPITRSIHARGSADDIEKISPNPSSPSHFVERSDRNLPNYR